MSTYWCSQVQVQSADSQLPPGGGSPEKISDGSSTSLPKIFYHCFAVCKLQQQRCKEAHQLPVGEEELSIWDILVHQNNIILHCILHHPKAVMGTVTIHEEKPWLTTCYCFVIMTKASSHSIVRPSAIRPLQSVHTLHSGH